MASIVSAVIDAASMPLAVDMRAFTCT